MSHVFSFARPAAWLGSLMGAMALSGCVIAPVDDGYYSDTPYYNNQVDGYYNGTYYPAIPYEVMPAPPYAGAVWVQGVWEVDRGRRYWRPGRYERPGWSHSDNRPNWNRPNWDRPNPSRPNWNRPDDRPGNRPDWDRPGNRPEWNRPDGNNRPIRPGNDRPVRPGNDRPSGQQFQPPGSSFTDRPNGGAIRPNPPQIAPQAPGAIRPDRPALTPGQQWRPAPQEPVRVPREATWEFQNRKNPDRGG